MICAVTGHRPDKLYGYNMSHPRYTMLRNAFKKLLIKWDCSVGITGMALGTDMEFAMSIIELKDSGYDIKLHCYIPCKNHTSMWHDEKIIELYNYILSRADYIKYVSENNYTQNCMQKRNEAMVDSCNIVLAVLNGSSGGTCNCVNYARKRNKNIYIINP